MRRDDLDDAISEAEVSRLRERIAELESENARLRGALVEEAAKAEYLLTSLEAMQELEGVGEWPDWGELPKWKTDDALIRAERVVYEMEKARALDEEDLYCICESEEDYA